MTKRIGQHNVLTFSMKRNRIEVDSTVFNDDPIYDMVTLDTEYSNQVIKTLGYER